MVLILSFIIFLLNKYNYSLIRDDIKRNFSSSSLQNKMKFMNAFAWYDRKENNSKLDSRNDQIKIAFSKINIKWFTRRFSRIKNTHKTDTHANRLINYWVWQLMNRFRIFLIYIYIKGAMKVKEVIMLLSVNLYCQTTTILYQFSFVTSAVYLMSMKYIVRWFLFSS